MVRVDEVLLRSAELVEQGWEKHALARTANGREVVSTQKEKDAYVAVSFCMVGAYSRALDEMKAPTLREQTVRRVMAITQMGPSLFNSMAKSGAEVAAVFRFAAAYYEGQDGALWFTRPVVGGYELEGPFASENDLAAHYRSM